MRERAYALAAEQRWLIRRDQLVELGFGVYEIRKWRDQGALVHLVPGIYRLSVYPESWEQHVHAGVWWAGAGAAACGPSAAALHGLAGFERSGPVHLSVPGRPRLPRKCGLELVVHPRRVLGMWDLEQRDGLVFTRIERTLLDLAPTLPPERLEALVDECLRKELTWASRLHACLNRLKGKGRKGAGILGRLLKLRDGTLLRTDSPLEAQFLKLFGDQKLEVPRPRYWVCRGETRYRLDFAYVAGQVGIEIDSREHHDGWPKRLHDMARQNDLVSWGWRILRFTRGDLERPRQVAQIIRETLARASCRSAA